MKEQRISGETQTDQIHWTKGASAHTQDETSMHCLRLGLLAFICTSASWANTCSPLNTPGVIIQGATFQPAIVNGIDNVSYSQVRFQWTSDAATTPINYQRIVYATAAQWAANGNRIIAGTAGVNYGVGLTTSATVTANDTIQGGVISNLLANTSYHIAGQSSPDGGSTFCPAVEETFTTSAFNGVEKPPPPLTFPISRPTVSGTEWVLDGLTGTGHCPNLQACFIAAQPGDGITLSHTTPAQFTGAPLYLPTNPNAIGPLGFDFSTNKINLASHSLSNGDHVHVGNDFWNTLPIPLQTGITYSIVNAHPNDFQLSLDGTNPVTLASNGVGDTYLIKWPNTQPWIVVHSDSPANSLPPDGVRLDPVYSPALAKIQLTAPYPPPGDLLSVNRALSAFYYFEDIEWDMLPERARRKFRSVSLYLANRYGCCGRI